MQEDMHKVCNTWFDLVGSFCGICEDLFPYHFGDNVHTDGMLIMNVNSKIKSYSCYNVAETIIRIEWYGFQLFNYFLDIVAVPGLSAFPYFLVLYTTFQQNSGIA